MDSNVISFESYDSEHQIAAHQAGLPRVVLEGQTDVKLFKQFWFPELLDTFEFIEAVKVGGGAGCTGVEKAVTHSQNEEGIPAIGIVDRDTLFRERQWDRLFSIDPAHVNPDWPSKNVYVTSRWEVEAYLLEPNLIANWVEVAHQPPPASPDDCERALSRTLEACEVLLAAADYIAAQHEIGTGTSLGLFCNEPLARVIEVCNEKIAADPRLGDVSEQIREMVTAIKENLPEDQYERLRFLLRYVDTKRLLARLVHALKVRSDAHWILAGFMRKEGSRPAELEQLLGSIEAELGV